MKIITKLFGQTYVINTIFSTPSNPPIINNYYNVQLPLLFQPLLLFGTREYPLTIMTYVTNSCHKVRTSVLKGIQSPSVTPIFLSTYFHWTMEICFGIPTLPKHILVILLGEHEMSL